MPVPHCPMCGGSLKAQTISHQQYWGEQAYEFEDVPALICVQCGEVTFEAAVTQEMDRIVQTRPSPIRYHQAPVYSMANSVRS